MFINFLKKKYFKVDIIINLIKPLIKRKEKDKFKN